jgi:uncharacterized protein
MIHVEVAYSTENYNELIPLKVKKGTSVIAAIQQSGILQLYPETIIKMGNIGIFSKLCTEDTVLNEGDRIEIYRPLKADPKEARRRRAERQKKS